MVIALSSLMSAGGEERILDHMVNRKRLFVPATKAAQASAIVPWATFNELIAGGSLPFEHFRLIRTNRTIPYDMFCRPGPRPEVRASALHQLIAQGVSIIVNRIDKYVPQVGALAADLERRIGSDIQVNCYVSFAKEGAFLAHHDGHDVIVLQVHGKKHWRTFGMFKEGQPKPSAQEMKDAAPEWEQTLSPGDILFLPRGEIHDASALSSDSLHLTIGIHPRTGADLLRWLADNARSGSPLDTGLMRLGSTEQLAQQETALKLHLRSLIDQLDLSNYLVDDDARRAPRPLVSVPLSHEIAPATRVLLLLRRAIRFPDSDAAEVSVVIGSESIKLGRPERVVLSLLVERSEVALSEIEAALAGRVASTDVRRALRALAENGLVALIADAV